MTKVFINAVSCKAGGGVNDLVYTLPLLDQRLRDVGWDLHTWVVEPGWQGLTDAGYLSEHLTQVDAAVPRKRAFWEFMNFPRIVRNQRPEAVFQFSNFIFRKLPVPQITVLRSPTFFSGLYATTRRRGIYQTLRYRLGCHYSRKTVERAAAVFCISDTHRRDIIRTLGPVGEKVKTSYLGFERPATALQLRSLARREVLLSLPEEIRERLSPLADSKRQIIVNVAHYYEHKNLGNLLQAVDLLKTAHPNLALILTAGLTNYNGPRDKRTAHDTQQARRLAQEGILFDLGPVPKEWVWKLLALADVFAFPSSLESFGHPLLEAMSMQVPVVAADTRIHREITGDAACFHTVDSASDLAARIADLVTGRIDRTELIQRGVARAEVFSWGNHAQTLATAIQASGFS